VLVVAHRPAHEDPVAQPLPERNPAAVRLLGLAFSVLAGVALVAGFASGNAAPNAPAGSHGPRSSSLGAIPNRTLYFAAFDDFPADQVASLVDYYRARYGITAKVLPLAGLDPAAWDEERGQFVAEGAIASIKAVHGNVAGDPRNIIIGLIAADLYIRDRPDWKFAFGLRSEDGRIGVVSTARMGWPGGARGQTELPVRLRKMVSRDVGFLYFGLAPTNDPSSVLYRDVLGVDDLDRMSDDF
jgi:predicted Zn-dependent protease